MKCNAERCLHAEFGIRSPGDKRERKRERDHDPEDLRMCERETGEALMPVCWHQCWRES